MKGRKGLCPAAALAMVCLVLSTGSIGEYAAEGSSDVHAAAGTLADGRDIGLFCFTEKKTRLYRGKGRV